MRRFISSIVATGCLLAVPAAVSAQTGSIAGTITTSSSSTSSVVVYDANGSQVATAPGPSYTVGNLTPGTYFVTASASGHVTELFDNIPCVAADCVPTSGTAVTVTAGGTATANFTLTTGGRILGTVRRASDSTAVSSVTVFLYNAATSLVTTTSTAVDGTYQFSTLPSGSYFLRIGGPTTTQPSAPDYVQELYGGALCPLVSNGFGCRIVDGTPVAVTEGSDTTSIDFSLDHGARINGQTTLGGVPVAGATITAYAAGQPIGFPAITDSSGFYTVQGLAPGHYFVRANPATSATANLIELWYNNRVFATGQTPTVLTLTAGQAATGINFAFTAGGTINGTVTFIDPGAGSFNAESPPTIEVYNTSNMLVRSKVLTGSSPISYQIDGLPTGTYYVKTASTAKELFLPLRPSAPISPPSGLFIDEVYDNVTCVTEDCLPTSGTPVAVTAGQNTVGVDFALTVGGRITGAAAAFSLEVYDSRGVRLPRRIFKPFFGSTFEAKGLPSGTYYLRARGRSGSEVIHGSSASELYRGIACGGCAVTFGTPVVVTAGEVLTGVDFTGITGGTIAGTVSDDAMAGLSTVTVEIYSADGALVDSATTSFNGQYRVDRLAPGSYRVRTVNTRGYVDEVFDNHVCSGCSVTSGTAVTVTASATTTVNFTLALGTFLGGQMRADFSGPLPGMRVSMFDATGTLVAQATADSLGTYAVALPAGSYRARTDIKSGYIQELYNNQTCALGNCDVTTGTAITLAATPLTNIDFSLSTCSPRTISPTRLATAAVGSGYRQVLVASGSTTTSTRRFSIASGTLPPGLTLDATTGVISGTPTTSSSYAFTVAVSDASGCAGTRDYVLDTPACAFTLGSTSASISSSAQSMTVNLSSTCGTVTAAGNDSWLTINSAGSSSVSIAAAANIGASPRTGTVSIGPRVFTVYQSGTTNAAPFGSFDTPLDGSSASGSIPVTGWALDDLGVARVTIYRDPVGSETPGVPVFIGEATLVTGARPDVEAIYPTLPFANRAGWGYLLLTNMLPNQGNGTFRLLAFAEDGTGTSTLLGSRTFVGNNATATAPFGAIDTPAQGATISGTAYVNFGWALTPQPKMIPFSGSTVIVFIDGVSIGAVDQYNLFRSDVSNLFPNLKNSGGPVGHRTIDTTALTEGVHTISWGATDDAGQATGIGSRYFTVNNSAWQAAATAAVEGSSSVEFSTNAVSVPPRVAGPDLGRRSASLALLPIAEDDEERAAARQLKVRELQRIELDLRSEGTTCDASFAGYIVARGEVRELPLGSTLDAAGRFYWQTTPGFLGTYRFVFVRTACDGTRERIPVTITISPR